MKIAFSLTMLASLHIIVKFELELEHRQRIETDGIHSHRHRRDIALGE